MKAHRARRLAALSAAGVLMAGGAVVTSAASASAATPDHVTQVNTNRSCYWWGHCFDRSDFFRNNFNNGGVPVVIVVVS
ncbi:hypothetical protein [Streptomyces cellostaticus]|uniref:hypothetical protein n=1 Tax=Streptomyces TaxID=1883 RepID=UPI002025C5B1|nr:hypothetical protein [Streptomyces cellostaticus]